MTIRVGFDYDEPIFPWYDYAHDVSVAAGLARAEDPPPTVWDPHSHYGCTQDEWVAVLDAEVDKGGAGMYGRRPRLGVVSTMRRMYRMGYEIHLVTARGSFGTKGDRIRDLTKTQVFRHKIPYDGLHFTPNKTEIIQRLGLDYFIDDRPKHYEEAVTAGADTFLLNAPWNQDYEVPASRRVRSTQEYIEWIIARHGRQDTLDSRLARA